MNQWPAGHNSPGATTPGVSWTPEHRPTSSVASLTKGVVAVVIATAGLMGCLAFVARINRTMTSTPGLLVGLGEMLSALAGPLVAATGCLLVAIVCLRLSRFALVGGAGLTVAALLLILIPLASARPAFQFLDDVAPGLGSATYTGTPLGVLSVFAGFGLGRVLLGQRGQAESSVARIAAHVIVPPLLSLVGGPLLILGISLRFVSVSRRGDVTTALLVIVAGTLSLVLGGLLASLARLSLLGPAIFLVAYAAVPLQVWRKLQSESGFRIAIDHLFFFGYPTALMLAVSFLVVTVIGHPSHRAATTSPLAPPPPPRPVGMPR